MKTGFLPLCIIVFAIQVHAATDVRFNFTLNTADPYGAPLQQSRYYWLYRPDNLPKSTPVPLIVFLDGSAPAIFHRKADQAGFVVASCSFSGNSSGTPATVWINDNPRIAGYEDFDYLDEVIKRVKASDNCNDVFTVGLSKNGHMSLAYACERPYMIKAAATIDEFMGLTSNIPSAPVPIIAFQGTLDTNVPYTMVKDTLDAWRAVDGLLHATPVTTCEASPLIPGKVSQVTWRGGRNGTQVALVTIIGGTHTYPTPAVQTGYDFTDGVWAFFSQFLAGSPGSPKIVSQPVDNIQVSGQPASFWVAATGSLPLRYQWQKNGQDIPGATANWFTTPPTTPGDGGATFRAVVRNNSGSVTSAPATLNVTVADAGTAPTIIIQPADQIATAGQPVRFVVAASGDPPLSYQWKKNGVIIPGATAASFAIPAAIAPDCGANFTVVVANGTGSITSTRATLTVTPAADAPIMIRNVERSRVLAGQAATFSVAAWSASPMRYQWQKGIFTGNMSDVSGATAATYTIASPTLADHLTLYRCVVSNAAGNVTSASEMLFVTADIKAPTDITSPITASVQVGVPFTYTITSSGGTAPITYSASPLPGGLSLDQNSGLISGTPAATGTTKIVMDASNSAGHFSRTLILKVSDTQPAVSLDAWRFVNFGASEMDPSIAGDTADPDGDGYTNLDEFNFGSNPLDPASVPEVQTNFIFPQFADGGGYVSNFLLTNPSSTATTATLAFFGNDGTPLSVIIDGAAATSHDVPVPSHGSAKVSTSGLPLSFVAGWVRVTTNPSVDLGGNAVFQFFKGSTLFSEASVPGVLPVSSMDFFADEEGGFKTGFALANPGAIPASGTLTLRRKDGTEFGTMPISLAPSHHTAIYLWQLFGENAPSGRAEINLTSGYLAATALRFHTSSVFSTLSVGQPGFAPAGTTALFSPGGGVRDRLIAEINKAQATLDIAIYSFTADAIRDALIAARNRGVAIRIIADASQADGSGSEITTLEHLGFNLKRMSGAFGGIMHNKFMIIDGKLLFTGSYNWSASAETSNYENALFLTGATTIQKYQTEFDLLWGN